MSRKCRKPTPKFQDCSLLLNQLPGFGLCIQSHGMILQVLILKGRRYGVLNTVHAVSRHRLTKLSERLLPSPQILQRFFRWS